MLYQNFSFNFTHIIKLYLIRYNLKLVYELQKSIYRFSVDILLYIILKPCPKLNKT